MKDKVKFFKTIPATLLSIAAVFLILGASLLITSHISNVSEEKKLLAELENKNHKDITQKDFDLLFVESEEIDPGEFDKFVGNGRVLWMVTQGHEKDRDSIKIVGRYNFDIEGKAQFFKITPRAISITNLEVWADRNKVKVANLPSSPKPPSEGLLSHIQSGPGILSIGFIAVTALFLLWLFLWGPMSGINRFVRGQELKPEKNNTRFSDIAGIDEKLTEVKEAVDLLRELKERIARNKGKPRVGDVPKTNSDEDDEDTYEDMIKGILLVGPPGTGKTLTAMAIAGEAGVPFFHMNGSSFVEMFVGVGAKRVRALFRAAKKKAPSIIFVDEIDAVGGKRQPDLGFGATDERSTTVNAFLAEIDGFDKGTPILLIGATNRPEILDDALMRPGRFTRQIHLDPPAKEGRKAILELHAKRLRKIIADDVSFETIAKQTPGLTGDHLRNLVNEANILARRRKRKEGGRKTITRADFEEALERVIYGPENKSRIITPKEKKMYAEHEAGHTLVGYELEKETGDPVHIASIIQRDRIGGHVQTLNTESPVVKKTQMEARLAVYSAGFVAEEIQYSGDVSTAAASDMEYVTSMAISMITELGMGDLEQLGFRKYKKPEGGHFIQSEHSEEMKALIEGEIKKLTLHVRARARKILEEKRRKFLYLVEQLMEKEVISDDALRKILKKPVPKGWRPQNE